ncbi:hypothetical protein [Leptospira kirschneri]|uniref:hypothetical protein n=1 Tax=Leptospira kirschneri TaxID=29507 RepID=UPI00046C81E5|nr:hypothetical protein [Leptospira kirschneri]
MVSIDTPKVGAANAAPAAVYPATEEAKVRAACVPDCARAKAACATCACLFASNEDFPACHSIRAERRLAFCLSVSVFAVAAAFSASILFCSSAIVF